MTTTTYYNLNIVEGTDIVNPLVVDNPNYQKIDETMHDNAVSGVTLATEIANATVHAITRENSECAVIRFIATSEWKAGDTATVDGVPVTALLPSGETLPDGAYVINANVLCILTGTNLTIYADRKKTENANEIAYNDTTVGAELVRLDNEIDNVNTNLKRTNNVLALNGSHGTIVSYNCDYYENGIYHIDIAINISTEVPSSGQIVSLTKNGQLVTFTRRLDAFLKSSSGTYDICLLPNTNSFFANGLSIPVGFYKLKMDVSE